MALAALVVRIGADVSDLSRGLAKADRDVERFGKKIQPLGRSLARIGNSASMAAGSLSRLGGVLPGVVGGTGALVSTLGTASVVLGETTVLTAGLTKGMRLLQAASLAVAASSAPAWIASLATPAGIAVAGIVALTGAVAGLTYAWKRLTDTQKSGGVRSLEVVDPSGRGRGSSEAFFANQDATFALSDARVELTLAKQAVEAWGQAVEGMRPVTVRLVEQWAVARDLITAALKDTSRFTADATSQLYQMLAAMKEVARIAPLMSPSEAASGIRKDLFPQKMFGHGLNPRQFLGDRMDFRPTPMRDSGFLGDVMSGIKPRDHQGNEMNLGQQIGGMLGGAAGGMVQAFASFGPMAAILPVISGALEALEPVLKTLIEPLVELGRIVAEALAPIFKMLAPVIQLIADMLARQLAPVLKVFVFGLSLTMEALGWLVRGLGKLVDALPGVSAKGVINAGQEMIDAARAARKNTSATENATNAVNEFAAALTNIPRVLNINALRHLISGGSRGGGGGGGGGGDLPGGKPFGGGGLKALDSSSNVTINVYGATDPIRTADALADVLDRRRLRGGTHRLTVATE